MAIASSIASTCVATASSTVPDTGLTVSTPVAGTTLQTARSAAATMPMRVSTAAAIASTGVWIVVVTASTTASITAAVTTGTVTTITPTAAADARPDRALSVAAASAPTLDGFLAGVERRAVRIAQLGTGGDFDEALDCVQEAMIQLARHYAGRPAAEWPPLFYRILDNRLRKWRYKQLLRGRWLGRRVEADDDSEDDPLAALPAGEDSAPDLRLQQAQVRQRVRAALVQLPARQRQAFLLRHWEGLSTAETAQAMACSEGSVKTHLSRAIAALHPLLAQEGLQP